MKFESAIVKSHKISRSHSSKLAPNWMRRLFRVNYSRTSIEWRLFEALTHFLAWDPKIWTIALVASTFKISDPIKNSTEHCIEATRTNCSSDWVQQSLFELLTRYQQGDPNFHLMIENHEVKKFNGVDFLLTNASSLASYFPDDQQNAASYLFEFQWKLHSESIWDRMNLKKNRNFMISSQLSPPWWNKWFINFFQMMVFCNQISLEIYFKKKHP